MIDEGAFRHGSGQLLRFFEKGQGFVEKARILLDFPQGVVASAPRGAAVTARLAVTAIRSRRRRMLPAPSRPWQRQQPENGWKTRP